MANPEHVEIVKQGQSATREWERSHPGQGLDLFEADLKGLDPDRRTYYEDKVGWTFLHLSNADLRRARLVEAQLGAARLNGADLRGANLSCADLRLGQLQNADLRGANLLEADLTNADLQGANLDSARLAWTNLGGANLTGVRGLSSVDHQGPSVIDEPALRKSWPLPEVFLRGCGLSDQYIEYLPSLMGKAIEFYSCFISYSSKDQDFADRLHADLQDNGVRCWFAPEDLKIGDRTRIRIDESIRLHDKLLLILSGYSVESQWVEQEVETALEKEQKAMERDEQRTVLFPIRVDDAVLEMEGGWAALIRKTRHIGDFTRWKQHDEYEKAFARLLRDLKADGKAVPSSA